jgi:hypothetical protein
MMLRMEEAVRFEGMRTQSICRAPQEPAKDFDHTTMTSMPPQQGCLGRLSPVLLVGMTWQKWGL